MPVARVHHDGGEVVVRVGRQPLQRRGELLVRLRDRQVAVERDAGVPLRGRHQLALGDGAVGGGADRPVGSAGLVRLKDGRRGGRRDVLDLRIARQQARVLGRLGALLRVHARAGDCGGNAGADVDVVREHGDDGAGRVDVDVFHVAVARDRHARVEVQRLDRGVGVEYQRRTRSLFVNGQILERSGGDTERRAGRLVVGELGGQVLVLGLYIVDDFYLQVLARGDDHDGTGSLKE